MDIFAHVGSHAFVPEKRFVAYLVGEMLPLSFSLLLHLACAAFWVGGMLFLPLVLLPSIKDHPDRVALLYKTGLQFRFYGWIVMGLLLLSGFSNLYFKGIPFSVVFFMQNAYGKMVMVKLLGFCLILLTSGVHDWYFGKKALENLQENPDPRLRLLARWTGRVNLLLALGMMFLGLALSRGLFFFA